MQSPIWLLFCGPPLVFPWFASAHPLALESMTMPVAKLERITSWFGYRHGVFHPGVDLAAPYGSPVRAAVGGTVVYVGWLYDYGNAVEVRDPSGIVTRYAHLAKIDASVFRSGKVTQGDLLGTVGTTGHAHGPHLHFEVILARKSVNPAPYLTLGAGADPIEVAAAPPARRTGVAREKTGRN